LVVIMPARRIFLGLIASLASLSHAQRAPQTIGLLSYAKEATSRETHQVLEREMIALGYGKSRLNIVLRIGDGEITRLPALAEELARLKVDLIVAAGTTAVVAARRANPTVPIVFFSVADPVLQGLAESLARPGRNVTGLTNFSAGELVGKQLELLGLLLPDLARVAFLVNPTTAPPSSFLEKAVRDLEDRLRIRGLVVRARSFEELESAFQLVTAFHAQAVHVSPDGFLSDAAPKIVEISLRNRVGSVWSWDSAVEVGGLMSYGPDYADTLARVASYVAKILQGERAGDLPIQQPSKLELVINRKTAAALGLKIPQALLLQADRVID
jgi:putative ABC transport system substrate-binding protein